TPLASRTGSHVAAPSRASLANSAASACGGPSRDRARSSARSSGSPVWTSRCTSSRRWLSSSSSTSSVQPAVSASARRQSAIRRPMSGMLRPPQPSQGLLHHRPLFFLLPQRLLADGPQRVVFALSPRLRLAPTRLDQTLRFEAVQNGVEHAVRPGNAAAGQFAYAADDGVAVTLALFEKRQNERHSRRGDEDLSEFHAVHDTSMFEGCEAALVEARPPSRCPDGECRRPRALRANVKEPILRAPPGWAHVRASAASAGHAG